MNDLTKEELKSIRIKSKYCLVNKRTKAAWFNSESKEELEELQKRLEVEKPDLARVLQLVEKE